MYISSDQVKYYKGQGSLVCTFSPIWICLPTSIGILIIKINRSGDRLIFIIESIYLGKRIFILRRGPSSHDVGRLPKLPWHLFTIHYSGNNHGTTPRVLLEACIVIGMEWLGSDFMMNKVLVKSYIKESTSCRRYFHVYFLERMPMYKYQMLGITFKELEFDNVRISWNLV